MGINNKYFYKGLLAFSFSINLLWILFVNTQPFSDFSYYNHLAGSIARGGPWGDTYTAVGYSIILGLFYKLFGSHLFVAKSLNLVLSTVNVVLFVKIIKSAPISERGRKIVSLIFVVFPANIYFNSLTGTEVLFSTILLLINYLYFKKIRYKYFWIGLLAGIGTMVKPFFPMFFLVVLITELVSDKGFYFAVKNSFVVLIICFVAISPWLYRNYKVIGEFTYVSNNGGIVLYINNNSQNKNGGWMDASEIKDSLVNTSMYEKANPTERNNLLSKAAKQWIMNHPKEFLVLGAKRIIRTYFKAADDINFSFYGSGLNEGIKTMLYISKEFVREPVFIFGILFIFLLSLRTILNLFHKAKLNHYDLFLMIQFYMFSGIYFMMEGQSRYAFPVIFILIYFFYRAIKCLASVSRKGKEVCYF